MPKAAREHEKPKLIVDNTGPAGERIIAYATADNEHAKVWQNHTGSWRDVLVPLLTTHHVGEKSGASTVLAELKDSTRTADQFVGADAAALDLDAGHDPNELAARVRELGVEAVIASTYNYLQTQFEMRADPFDIWDARNDGGIVEYLIQERTRTPEYAAGAKIIGQETRETERRSRDPKTGATRVAMIPANYMTIETAPCPKLRLVVPFAATITDPVAFKAAVNELAAALDVVVDLATVDVVRLFFDPRCRKDAETFSLHIKGNLYAPAPPEPAQPSAAPTAPKAGKALSVPRTSPASTLPRPLTTAAGYDPNTGPSSLGLTDFLVWQSTGLIDGTDEIVFNGPGQNYLFATADGIAHSSIVELLADKAPHVFDDRKPAGDRFYIQCPREDRHTTADTMSDTWIAAPTDGKPWNIWCHHTHCNADNELGETKCLHPATFLAAMLNKGWITPNDLADPKYQPALIEVPAPTDPATDQTITVWNPNDTFEAIPRPQFVIRGVAIRGEVTILSGQGGVGKSTLAVLLALSVASGANLVGYQPLVQGNVLIINNEDATSTMRLRLYALKQHFDLDGPFGNVVLRGVPTDPDESRVILLDEDKGINHSGINWLNGIVKNQNIDLMVIDPLALFSMGDVENSATQMSSLMAEIKRVAILGNCAVIVIDHNRKSSRPGEDNSADAVRGSSAKVASARIAMAASWITEAATKSMLGWSGKTATHKLPIDQQDQLEDIQSTYFSVIGTKANLSKRERIKWFKQTIVDLPDGTDIAVPTLIGGRADIANLIGVDRTEPVAKATRATTLADLIVGLLPDGGEITLADAHKKLRKNPRWPWHSERLRSEQNFELFTQLGENGIRIGDKLVSVSMAPATGNYVAKVAGTEADNGGSSTEGE